MSKLADLIFFRRRHVCPWWLCFTFDNVFRRLIHDPYKILRPFIKEGDTILDVGPGMGYFTIPMAHLAGDRGLVIAADIQEKMLSVVRRRATDAGVDGRIITHLSSEDSLGVDKKVDFILAFWMVHEVPDQRHFWQELFSVLKEKGTLLLVEPLFHVTDAKFENTVKFAVDAGFTVRERPGITFSKSVLFCRK